MRVLQIITSLGTGGAEKLLVDTIPMYKNYGIDIEVLLINGNRTPFYDILENQHVKIQSLCTGNLKKVYNPFLIIKFIPFIKKKYDIIHVHLFPTLYWVVLARLISFSKVRLIFTEHSTHNRRMERKLWQIVDRFIYRYYQKIIAVTEDVFTDINSYLKLEDSRFVVIKNGINLSPYSVSSHQKPISSDRIIKLIQIAGFRYQKDQITVIRSLLYLPDNVHLLLVGDGDTRPQCERLVEELKLSGRVFFLGVRTDVPNLLFASDIVIQSSLYEGFGLAAVEGMAAGKPVIASDISGFSEVVGEVGILFPVRDEKALAKEVNKLLSDSGYYHEVAARCKAFSKKYDMRIMVHKYINLYKNLCT